MTAISYVPAGNPTAEYSPFAEVDTWYLAPLAEFVTRTSACGRGTPRLSKTMPETVPGPVCAPSTAPVISAATTATIRTLACLLRVAKILVPWRNEIVTTGRARHA